MNFRKSKYYIIYCLTLFILSNCNTVKDIDGNTYCTIKIGTQIWMVENLRVTHYQNGELIPNITSVSEWGGLTSGGYCDFNNESEIGKIYGHLYNFYAASDKRNIAPKGWHVATYADWDLLTKNSSSNTVDKLKEKGVKHWYPPNSSATNESGFTALPGAYRGEGKLANWIWLQNSNLC
jgi:uncharacterized protein (TIGR02145 family)